jgi:hypothetical protein
MARILSRVLLLALLAAPALYWNATPVAADVTGFNSAGCPSNPAIDASLVLGYFNDDPVDYPTSFGWRWTLDSSQVWTGWVPFYGPTASTPTGAQLIDKNGDGTICKKKVESEPQLAPGDNPPEGNVVYRDNHLSDSQPQISTDVVTNS